MTTPFPPWLQYLDEEVFLAVHRLLHALSLGDFPSFANELGNGFVLIPLSLALLTLVRERRRAVVIAAHVALAMGLAGLVTHNLKGVLPRDRPARALPGAFPTQGQTLEAGSFPSGHTGAAFAWTMALYLWAKHVRSGWRRTLLRASLTSLACCAGLARLYLGVHFLLDILGGAAIGWGAAQIVWWLTRLVAAGAHSSSDG